MKTVLVAAALAGLSLPAVGQTKDQTNNGNPALADCLRAADQKYKDTWAALCAQAGRGRHCTEFIGSPRDKEFSQLRIDEMTLCSKLYSK